MSHHLIRTCVAVASAALISVAVWDSRARAATGTFLDRQLPTDIRLVSYNVDNDSIFPDTNPTRAANFARVAAAVDADIWSFQEFNNHTASQAVSLMNSIVPLGPGKTWFAYKGGLDQVIVSKYSLSLTAQDTFPAGDKQQAMALVNLTSAGYSKNLYLMDEHYKAFSGFDDRRQKQSDALVNWMRDARTAGGSITLPAGTPMVIAGDLNLVDSTQPRDTLIDGNIINNGTFGADSPPDWDGSNNTDAHPLHNVVGPDDYTWRDDTSVFPPGRLDAVIYTDSVIDAPHRFVLDTPAMTAGDRANTGLQPGDSVLSQPDGHYDHLPLIVDFRLSGVKSLTWNPAADTTWNTVNPNWLRSSGGSVNFSDGDVALFGDAGVGTVTIAMQSDPASGAVIIANSSGTYSFVGGAIRGTAALTKLNAGAVTFLSANTYTGGTTVAGGIVTVADPDGLGSGSLAITQTGRVVLADGLAKSLKIVGSLLIRDSGVLDLRNNSIVVDYSGTSPLTTLESQLGTRITSTLTDASHRIGFAEASALGLISFGGRSIDSTSLLMRFTFAGDANLDGQVDVTDLGALASHWQTNGTWAAGDFNYDSVVDVSDLGLLASNWQAGASASSAMSLDQALQAVGLGATNVPEPALIGLSSLLLVASSCSRTLTKSVYTTK